jgi:hypothetical protein
MAEKPDAEVQEALLHLLRASRQFANAYDAYSHAPRQWVVARRHALESAERELDAAEREVAAAQRHHPPTPNRSR